MTLLSGSIEDQILLVLKNTQACLTVFGSSLDRVISCNVFIIDGAFQRKIEPLLRKKFHPNAVLYFIQVPALPRNADLEIQPRAFHKDMDYSSVFFEEKNNIVTIGFLGHIGFVTHLCSRSEGTKMSHAPNIVFYNLKKVAFPPLDLFPNSTLVPVDDLMDHQAFLLEYVDEI